MKVPRVAPVLVLLAAAGCSPQPPEVAPRGVKSQADVDFVERARLGPGLGREVSDEELLGIGYARCKALDDGASAQEVLTDARDDDGAGGLQVVLAAKFFLCIEHSPAVGEAMAPPAG